MISYFVAFGLIPLLAGLLTKQYQLGFTAMLLVISTVLLPQISIYGAPFVISGYFLWEILKRSGAISKTGTTASKKKGKK